MKSPKSTLSSKTSTLPTRLISFFFLRSKVSNFATFDLVSFFAASGCELNDFDLFLFHAFLTGSPFSFNHTINLQLESSFDQQCPFGDFPDVNGYQ